MSEFNIFDAPSPRPIHGLDDAVGYLRSVGRAVEAADGIPGLYNVGGHRDLTVGQVIDLARQVRSL